MDLLDYLKLNARHYSGKLVGSADDLYIRTLSRRHVEHLSVPAWNQMAADKLKQSSSLLSRIIALNTRAEADAARILGGEHRLFGRSVSDEDGCPDWSKDYLSGHRFPVQPYGRYEVALDTGADIICPWELSHLKFIPTLIGAHRTHPDPRYPEHFFSVLDDWRRANPYLIGVNWMCGLDVAIRALNIALGIVYFGSPDDPRTSQAVRLLWVHLVYLQKRDLYLHKTVVNNHQLVAAVLHFGLLHLFESAPAARWKCQVRDVVVKEVPRQFREDGGNFESAFLYHQFVLESLYVALALVAHDDFESCFGDSERLPVVLRDRIWAASRFSADYARVWSGVPQVGDSSDGRILFHKDYFGWHPADCTHLADWAGIAFANDNPFLNRNAPAALLHRESGVGLFSAPGYNAIFLAMPISAGAEGHNHLDKASLLLRIGATQVFVDPGTFCYTSDMASRKHHRSGRAHNVLLIRNEDQAAFSGPGAFEVPAFRDVGIALQVGPTGDPSFEMWHDGYRRIQGIGTATRTVRCGADGLHCDDRIEGSGRVDLELLFALHPGLSCRVVDGGIGVFKEALLLCTVRPPDAWLTSTESAWYSPSYGVRQACTRLVFSAQVDLPCNVHTEIIVC